MLEPRLWSGGGTDAVEAPSGEKNKIRKQEFSSSMHHTVSKSAFSKYLKFLCVLIVLITMRLLLTKFATTEGLTTHYIPRTPNSKEYIPYFSKFQKIWSFWQILSHFASDFGNIVEYIPSIPDEVFQCIPYRNIFLVQYFRQWSTPRRQLTKPTMAFR